jgi:hypothetical protein
MVALIRMGREFGYAKLEAGVDQELELGCVDVAAIRSVSDRSTAASSCRSRKEAFWQRAKARCRP